jgi:peptide deformylase
VVRVQALDRQGLPLDIEAEGLYAVCIQHELDHLIGKVFLDRMTDLSTLTQLHEFSHYWQKEPASVI